MKNWKIWKKMHRMAGVILMLASLSLTACDDEEGYSLGDFALDWATVQLDGPHTCEFLGDQWGRLWPAATDVYLDQVTHGQRVILTFNPLYDDYPTGYDCSVKVLGLRPILTKGVEQLTETNEAEFGNDPLLIPEKGMWIGGNCLNVVFIQQLPVEKKHRISLVQRAEVPAEADGYVHLELRYNTFGDTTDHMVEAPVSYHLGTLLQAPEVKGLKVKVNAPGDGSKEWTFSKQSDEAAPAAWQAVSSASLF